MKYATSFTTFKALRKQQDSIHVHRSVCERHMNMPPVLYADHHSSIKSQLMSHNKFEPQAQIVNWTLEVRLVHDLKEPSKLLSAMSMKQSILYFTIINVTQYCSCEMIWISEVTTNVNSSIRCFLNLPWNFNYLPFTDSFNQIILNDQ
jgi:hypothetical protein